MYDVIIIGGGPAGLTAGIYLCRAGLKVKILEKESIGGQIASSPLVENYPGFKSISGSELADNLYEQVISLGAEIDIEEVIKISKGKVVTDCGEYSAKAIIVAVGSKYKTLGIDNEVDLIGKGIHFCVSCDGAFYKDKIVAVIGGANTAVGNAIYLSNLCKKVYLIYRGNELRCEDALKNKLKDIKNIEVLYNSNVVEFIGSAELEAIVVDTLGKQSELKLDGVFESIGMDAQTEILKGVVDMDKDGYIISNEGNTNIDGIFAAGDCSSKSVRQLTTAVNDGTVAAVKVIEYLKK